MFGAIFACLGASKNAKEADLGALFENDCAVFHGDRVYSHKRDLQVINWDRLCPAFSLAKSLSSSNESAAYIHESLNFRPPLLYIVNRRQSSVSWTTNQHVEFCKAWAWNFVFFCLHCFTASSAKKSPPVGVQDGEEETELVEPGVSGVGEDRDSWLSCHAMNRWWMIDTISIGTLQLPILALCDGCSLGTGANEEVRAG